MRGPRPCSSPTPSRHQEKASPPMPRHNRRHTVSTGAQPAVSPYFHAHRLPCNAAATWSPPDRILLKLPHVTRRLTHTRKPGNQERESAKGSKYFGYKKLRWDRMGQYEVLEQTWERIYRYTRQVMYKEDAEELGGYIVQYKGDLSSVTVKRSRQSSP